MAFKGLIKLDDRGRFQLPADIFRELDERAHGRYVVNRSTDKCVTLYPGDVWDIVRAKLDKINVFDPKKRALVRYFVGSATEISLDGKNRLLIPKDLKEYACFEKEILAVRLNPFVELWNPTLYNKQMEETLKCNPEDVSMIANEIFGDGSEFNIS